MNEHGRIARRRERRGGVTELGSSDLRAGRFGAPIDTDDEDDEVGDNDDPV